MKYLTGISALNLNCSLNTQGDWHKGNIDWLNLKFNKTEDSIFEEWGIEKGTNPVTGKEIQKANHIRAILDILEGTTSTNIKWLYQFKYDFICTDEYDELITDKVFLLIDNPNWDEIDKLMKRTFPILWRKKVYGLELPKRKGTPGSNGRRPERSEQITREYISDDIKLNKLIEAKVDSIIYETKSNNESINDICCIVYKYESILTKEDFYLLSKMYMYENYEMIVDKLFSHSDEIIPKQDDAWMVDMLDYIKDLVDLEINEELIEPPM